MRINRPSFTRSALANRGLPMVAKIAIFLMAICTLVIGSSSAVAVTRTWITFGSGDFNDPNNWFPAGIPDVNDFVSFEVGAGLPYTVTFPGNQSFDPVVNYTTGHFRVRDNPVTFSGSTQALRGPSAYTIASITQTEANRGIIIGVLAGDNAVLNVSHSGIVCCGGLTSLSGVAATLGHAAGSSGTLNMSTGAFHVTGSDASQVQLIVGNDGSGTISVNNGADVNVTGSNSRTSLGNHSTGDGVVTISGAGSTWTSANQLWIGENGSGTLTVQNGGSLITNGTGGTASSVLGTFSGGTGTVNITGAGSTWTSNSALSIGNSGDGTLVISSGGSLMHTNGFAPITIESPAGSAATISGAGSTFHTVGTLYVGSTGRGSMAVLNGGSVTSGSGQLRGLNAGSGDVLVSGAGSTWNVTNGLLIGLPEAGFTTGPTTLTINPGAAVSVGGNLDLHANSHVNLQGGTLDANAVRFLSGANGDFQWTSGTLHVGTFSSNLVNQGGTLAPGHSAGSTVIFGSYTQQANAALEIQIGGNKQGTDYDVVQLISTLNLATANLGGELELALLGGFEPAAASTFTVLTADDGIMGAFANVGSGQRLTTTDGFGSFLVHYGVGSPFDQNQIVLSDFLAILLGDFNGDGTYDCVDVDGLVNVIAAGTHLPLFDVTGDSLVDIEDLDAWRTIAGAANNPSGNPYLPGDATLDGFVDGSDFGVWNANKFTSTAAWCSGDFTADGSVDGSDFGMWNANKFTSSDSASVPEPTSMAMLLLILVMGTCIRGRSSR